MSTAEHDSPSRRWPWFTFACVLALADQLVKEIVHAQMSFGQVIPLTPFFNWVYTGNTGAPVALGGLCVQPDSWRRAR